MSATAHSLRAAARTAERDMHLFAGIGTVVLCTALLLPPTLLPGLFGGGGGSPDSGPKLEEMEAIEASLAIKSTKVKQPQKPKAPPPPPSTPDGVSRNDQQAPKDPQAPKPPPPDKPSTAKVDPNAAPATMPDDDTPPGDTTSVIGQFDGSDYGFAEVSKGDPYFQKLVGDLRAGWEYPEILSGTGIPVGCFRLAADGKMPDTLFKEKSGDDALDDSVERAIKRLAEARNREPEEVPTHLLKAATTRWICFRFKL